METKFQLSDMLGVALTLVVTAIAISYGLEVTSDVRDDMCPYGASDGLCLNSTGGTAGVPQPAEWNATGDTLTGVSKLSSKFPLIATVIVAAIVIGILVRYLAFNKQ